MSTKGGFRKEEYEAKQKKRFDEVKADIAAIEKKSVPLRAKRDEHVQKARAVEDKMNAEIKKAEEGLYELKCEFAAVARSLPGHVRAE